METIFGKDSIAVVRFLGYLSEHENAVIEANNASLRRFAVNCVQRCKLQTQDLAALAIFKDVNSLQRALWSDDATQNCSSASGAVTAVAEAPDCDAQVSGDRDPNNNSEQVEPHAKKRNKKKRRRWRGEMQSILFQVQR